MATTPAMAQYESIKAQRPDARVVIFHGKPNPDWVVNGWHSSNFLRSVRKTRWIEENWRL